MTVTDQVIGERVHQLMWRNRVAQSLIASRLGLGQSSLSRKLRGEQRWFATELVAVADALGTTIEALCAPETDDVRRQGLEPRTRWLMLVAPPREVPTRELVKAA